MITRYKLSHKADYVRPGTMRSRVVALIRRNYGYDKSFAKQEALDLIKASGVDLGSGDPDSFFNAFTKKDLGYFQEVQ